MLDFDITPYVTPEEADTYIATILDTDAWDDATEDQQLKALKQASRLIDSLNYIDDKASPTQEHAFPRTGRTGVPQEIQLACIELALDILDDVDGERDYDDQLIVSEGYASVRATYNRERVSLHKILGVSSRTAFKYLLPWLDLSFREITLQRA